MKTLAFILLLLMPFTSLDKYPKKFGKPTPEGVGMYVEDKWESLLYEYQQKINDTLWLDVWISAEDLTDWVEHDTLELGMYWNGEVIIDMDTLFKDYELECWSKIKRKLNGETNAFVKGTVFHELTHHYINQIGKEMAFFDSVRVNRAYETNIWIIRSPDMFGSTFIEEGICEYMVTKLGENIPPNKYSTPKTYSALVNKNNKYKYVYKYSSYYLKTFLDTTGFKKGVKILLSNEPPRHHEILEPELYFNRLENAEILKGERLPDDYLN